MSSPKFTSSRSSTRRALAVLVALGGLALFVAGPAGAAPFAADRLTTPKKPTGAAAPPKCEWTGTLPALPTGCTTAPTVADCTSTTYLAGPCGSNVPIIRKKYCEKVLVEDFCKGNAAEELVFPVANPKLTPIHGYNAGTASLYIPPGTSMAGKQMPYVGITRDGKAPPKLGLGAATGAAPGGGGGGVAGPGTSLSQHGTGYTLTTNGKGTFDTSAAPMWMAKYSSSHSSLTGLHLGLINGLAPAQANTLADGVFAASGNPEIWVGNGADTAANREVNSCSEFTYQRWYDFLRFKHAAKALGRDYRGVYALAVEPTSPVYLEKPVLKQFGSGTMASWPVTTYKDRTIELPRNVFFSTPSFTADVPEGKVQAITDRIKKYASGGPRYIKLPEGNYPRFELHRRLRNLLETKYKPSDDMLDERQARQDRYAELVASREELAPQLKCALDPYWCCHAPPEQNAGGTDKDALIAKVKGYAVVNPDPTKLRQLGANVGIVDIYNGFRGAEQVQVMGAARAVLGSPKGIDGKALTGGVKMKAPPNMPPLQQNQNQNQRAPNNGPTPQQNQNQNGANQSQNGANQNQNGANQRMPTNGPTAQVATNKPSAMYANLTCEQAWTAKLPSLQAAHKAVVAQLSDLVLKEFDTPQGCLEDPGAELGNSCDWSYQKFARFAMTYFDGAVQTSFEDCNIRTRGDFKNLRDQNKQSFIWPCEVRHDFGTDQLDAQYFMDSAKDEGPRKSCEQRRAQAAVDAYLKSNAETVKKIPVTGDHLGESEGDTWTLGDKDTFGAFLTYSVGWQMSGGPGNPKLNDGAWCRPVGSANMSGSTGFHFFGSEVKVFDGASNEETTADSVNYSAYARYRDLSHAGMKDLFPNTPASFPDNRTAKAKALATPVVVPASFALLGDIRYDFWASIGPVPLHVFFGAMALAGVDLRELGSPTSPTACNDKSKSIDNIPLNFATGTEFEPWARADAYADASLDVGVAAAGIHMDLLLLRLGLPTGASVVAAKGASVKLDTGSSLSVDALSGRVSAYVSVGVAPLSKTWEVTLFSWDGLHSDVALFGTSAEFPIKLATWVAQSQIVPEDVVCKNYKNPDPAIPADRKWCLKNPVIGEDKGATMCARPYTPPSGSPVCSMYYPLRGPTQ